MNDEVFERICALQEYPSDGRVLGEAVAEETFAVIKRQAEHRRLRATLRVHRQEKQLKRHIARHLGSAAARGNNSSSEPESMCSIARSVDFSPCMLARVILEAAYGWSKPHISALFKDVLAGTRRWPQRLPAQSIYQADNGEARAEMNETQYNRVWQDVLECIHADVFCSPLADRIRHNMGVEYEYILMGKLRSHGLLFESEDVLREKGLSKTPDVRLLLPIGVTGADGELHVVNWIDSKAMFGDRHTHETENASQLEGYVNRYGPGMVIYWFGHVANLSSDRDVFITDVFPADISLPGGLDLRDTSPVPQPGDAILLERCSVTTSFNEEHWDPVTTVHLLLSDDDDSVVAVVRRNQVLFLLYDQTIIGAEFDDPILREQAAFPGFAIMQSARYLDRDMRRALQIGLGIGTVPTFLRNEGIPTDVVEISERVVRQAADYFQYDRCAADDDDLDACPRGRTIVMDGLEFIHDNAPETPLYDVFTIDVYTGWNPFAFFVREVMEAVKAHWLTPHGVLVLNFVGFINGEHAAVPRSIHRTLSAVFPHVKTFREVPNAAESDAINIVFFASNEPFEFNVPTDDLYADPTPNTYYHVVRNFQHWQIFTDDEAVETNGSVEIEVTQSLDAEEVSFERSAPRAQILTQSDHGEEVFRATHTLTQEHMRKRVVEQFPSSMWAELGISV
ncbi:hypothetical protein ATCC90586_011511 [Pythium insidiosum]|nr:hypothetical protein ATCC90586_011511 [Pythium insidiosum]